MKPSILVLCTGNSARSQMGEGLFRHYVGDRFAIESAGTKPSLVRPEAIAVMAELGIDLSGHRSKSVEEFLDREFRYVVTVCDNAKESCPVLPGRAEKIHWSFEDPASVEGTVEERQAAFRRIRDQIRARVEEFTKSLETNEGAD
jgi:arsenate reductase